MSSEELRERLLSIMHNYSSFRCARALECFISAVYTIEWFDKNNNMDWYYSDFSIVNFPPLSLVHHLGMENGVDQILQYLIRLDEIIYILGEEKIVHEKYIKRFQNPLTVYKTFFELRILKCLAAAEADLTLDYKVKGKKDVEALVEYSEQTFFAECKCLGVSEIGLNHLRNESLLKGNILIFGHKHKIRPVGYLRFKDYCSEDEWDIIFSKFNDVANKGQMQTYKSHSVDLSIGLAGRSPYHKLDCQVTFPVDERAKTTIIKVKKKIKGRIPCVVFMNIPTEVGQVGVAKTIKNLLANRKNQGISQVILIDLKWTGEESHYSVYNYVNDHAQCSRFVNWNRKHAYFELVERHQVVEIITPEDLKST